MPFHEMPFHEMLVASPQHVRWVHTPPRFSLQKLGARPVDFSDPPGHLDRTWRNRVGSRIPWFGRAANEYVCIHFKLARLHGKLDAGYRTIICRRSDIWLADA